MTRRRRAALGLALLAVAAATAGCAARTAPHGAETNGSAGHTTTTIPAATTSGATTTTSPAARRRRVAHRRPKLDVYAADRPGRLAPAARRVPARVYVPN